MAKKLGSIMVFVLGGVLLVYSAARSLDFIQMTLPEDSKMLAYFGLAALDGGLIGWTLSYLKGSKGWQRAVSLIMAIVDLAGVIGFFTLDTLYQSGANGLTKAMTADQIQNAVLALSGIIGLNIAATVIHHMVDPESLREQAEEEAFDQVESATLKQISRNAQQLAAQLAPTLAADWMRQTQARYMANVGTSQVGKILDLPAEDVTPSAGVPLITAQPQAATDTRGLWGSLLAGIVGNKKNAPSVTAQAQAKTPSVNVPPIVDTPKAQAGGGLYGAFKQGVADAQGVTPDKLSSPLDGAARVLSQDEPFTPKFSPEEQRQLNTRDGVAGHTVGDVVKAGLCSCPPEVFDVDRAEPLSEEAQNFVAEKSQGRGIACYRVAQGGQRATWLDESLCFACPFFKNAPKP